MAQVSDRPKRLDLHLPLNVSGKDASGAPFAEQTRSLNVSGSGVGFECHKQVDMGAHVDVHIELPEGLRAHFGGKPVYRARAVVTRVDHVPGEDLYHVGARFTGEITD